MLCLDKRNLTSVADRTRNLLAIQPTVVRLRRAQARVHVIYHLEVSGVLGTAAYHAGEAGLFMKSSGDSEG